MFKKKSDKEFIALLTKNYSSRRPRGAGLAIIGAALLVVAAYFYIHIYNETMVLVDSMSAIGKDGVPSSSHIANVTAYKGV